MEDKVFISLEIDSTPSLIKIINILNSENIKFNITEQPSQIIHNKDLVGKANKANANYNRKALGKLGLDVLACLSEGCSYYEIADKTNITVDGVRYYIKKIFKALGVNNGREAVKFYLTQIQHEL